MEFALMFNVLEGGVVDPIKWSKENLLPERSIIVLDESNQAVWLWHGSKQGLVARRTALRQAESLKGHGYTVGKSIIGRDIKTIKEVDQRKIGRDPETDKVNQAFEEVLDRKYKELDNFVVTFSTAGVEAAEIKVVAKPTPKPEPQPTVKPEPKPVVSAPTPTTSKNIVASEYESDEPLPASKPAAEVKVALPKLKKAEETPTEQAKVAFVLKAVIEYFSDLWVSKKNDGSYAVEMMDGPVCQFSIKDGSIKFSANSFSGINPNIKTGIQKKFVELSKLIT
ncbi:MAG: hypothetical protein ACFFDK_18905 [Promethearchaeota archaeon]